MRELKTVKLPSGKQARIVTFFTRGEVKSIEEKKWQGATVSQSETGQVVISSIPVSQKQIQDDMTVLNGCKEIVNGDKVAPFTQEILDSMENDDFNLALLELEKLLEVKKK